MHLPFNAQIGQFLVRPISALFTWINISPETEMYPVVQEIDEAIKVSKLTGLSPHVI